MEIQILTKEYIKPSIPTPDHLKTMKISFLDQLAPPSYVQVILFYSPETCIATSSSSGDTVQNQLKRSLSETLTRYYPLAGRYFHDRDLVDCDDTGALYIEANVSTQLDQFLQDGPDIMLLNRFVTFTDENSLGPTVLAVQVNKFQCGGLAIGVCFSHRVTDGITIGSFLNAWAKACRADIDAVRWPNFDARTMFPARAALDNIRIPAPGDDGRNIVTKRFLFSGDAISKLKAKTGTSRVQAVTALVWKSLVRIGESKRGHVLPSSLVLSVNFRGKTVLPISENAAGNLYRMSVAEYKPNESSGELQDFVNVLKDSINKANEDFAKVENPDDVIEMATLSLVKVHEMMENEGNVDLCVVSSWCRFSFYEVDFGWGKPSWVSNVPKLMDLVILMDTKCGSGIEAWVSLEEENMVQFQQDEDIIAFTS